MGAEFLWIFRGKIEHYIIYSNEFTQEKILQSEGK